MVAYSEALRHNNYVVPSLKCYMLRTKLGAKMLLYVAYSDFLILWFVYWQILNESKELIFPIIIWASAWDFQQCAILTSADSDELVQSPLKLRNSKWCSVSSFTLIEYSSDLQRLWSDCAYAQADLRFCWSHIPCWKSHALAHLQFHVYRVAKTMV